MFNKFFLTVGLLSLFSLICLAQKKHSLIVSGLDSQYLRKQEVSDSVEALFWTQKTIQTLQKDGYWMASVDRFEFVDRQFQVDFYQGRKFDKLNVTLADISGGESVHTKRFLKQQRKIKNTRDFNRFVQATLELYENNGYPFASLSFDSISMGQNSIAFRIKIQKGPAITYDSLEVAPNDILRQEFLMNFLNLRYAGVYQELDIENIQSKMELLPFLELKKTAVGYRLRQAKPILEITPKKVNYFDGVLGVVPNRNNDGIELTGELNLSIKNLFRSAKSLEFHWTRMRPTSQNLEASYHHPAFLGTPIGLGFSFFQIKEDTLFSNQKFNLKFDYSPNTDLQTSFFYESRNGNELNDASQQSGDFAINFYGLSGVLSRLDNFHFPKNGWLIDLSASVGDKNDLTSSISSTQYRLKSKMEYYQPISSQSILYGNVKGGLVLDRQLYLNELFRLGGLQSVRGFDELAIFASKFVSTTMEWRLFFESKSYLVTFLDLAWTHLEVLNQSSSNQWQGFGAGMNLSTSNGQFMLLYAFGRSDDQSFSFDSSKFHLGYTANF